MKPGTIHLLAAVALLGCAFSARAAITCTNPTSTGFSTAYASAGVVPNVTQGTVSFTCTRTVVGDDLAVVLTADNGNNASGTQNQAKKAPANYLLYEAYKDSGCSAVWTSLVFSDGITVPLLNITVAQPLSVSFWGCIPITSQIVPAGNYTDTLSIRVRDIGNTTWLSNARNLSVTIVTPATCNITTSPGNVAFTYTAFGSAVNASTSFGTTCTSQLPYTMSLDAYVGVVAGLQYSLAINSLAPPVSSRGTGVEQTHTINGSMPAGQAGTCATGICSTTNVHTLTITY